MTDSATTTRAIVKQLQSHFDAFDVLRQERKQSHNDTQELWTYTKELHSTLQSIVQLPERYTGLVNESERLQIQTEHQELMQSLRKMRNEIDTLATTPIPTVTQKKTKLAKRAEPKAHPKNDDTTHLTDLTTADTITHTSAPPTTPSSPTTTIPPSSTYSNNTTPNAPRVGDTLDVSSVDNADDMLMSNDSSTDSLSDDSTLSHVSSASSSPSSMQSSSSSSVVTFPTRPHRVQKVVQQQRVLQHPSYTSNNRPRKNGQYTLVSLPKHSTAGNEQERKQKLDVNLVRQSGNGRVAPVSLQRHVFITTTPNRQSRHNRLTKIRQTTPPAV